MTDPESIASGIYVVAARDWSDALDMIYECEDVEALSLLLAMFEEPGGPDTDRELNRLFQKPTRERLARLKSFDRWLAANPGLRRVDVVGPDGLVHRLDRNRTTWESCSFYLMVGRSSNMSIADVGTPITCIPCMSR